MGAGEASRAAAVCEVGATGGDAGAARDKPLDGRRWEGLCSSPATTWRRIQRPWAYSWHPCTCGAHGATTGGFPPAARLGRAPDRMPSPRPRHSLPPPSSARPRLHPLQFHARPAVWLERDRHPASEAVPEHLLRFFQERPQCSVPSCHSRGWNVCRTLVLRSAAKGGAQASA